MLNSAEREELERGELDHCVSPESEAATGWKERGIFELNGSKGSSSSSSSGRKVDLNELGVADRGSKELSGVSGAAIANLDVGLWGLCAHRSGEGVSARNPGNVPGLDDAAERGRCIGLNSEAFAFKIRGEDMGDAGRLDANWACIKIGDELGESVMYDEECKFPKGDTSGV